MKWFFNWLFNFQLSSDEIFCRIIEMEEGLTEEDLRQASDYLTQCYKCRVYHRLKTEKEGVES